MIGNIDLGQCTVDSLFSGKIICTQNSEGYRFSIDPVLLSHFVDIENSDSLLDLGTGCGIIQLIILYRYAKKIRYISGIEIQDELCALAEKNISDNNYANKATIVQGNVRSINVHYDPESFEKIICNPPFFPLDSGRQSGNEQARIARHQIKGKLLDFIKAAKYCLKNRGAAYFIYPAEKITEFLVTSSTVMLEPKKLQFVYSYPGSRAKLCLIKCIKNGKPGVEVTAPLYIYQAKNAGYTDEIKKYYL